MAEETLFASDLLVHIGTAEVEAVLPTVSEYTRQLYDQIRDREKKLAKSKAEFELIVEDNENREKRLKELNEERDYLRNLVEEQRKSLDAERTALTIAHRRTDRTLKELDSVKHRIHQIQQRRENIGNQIAKQTELLEEQSQKLNERTMRKQSVDAKLSVAETSNTQIEDSLRKDAKTLREMETYLARITRQIYKRQREIDELKLGQLDKKAEAEGLRKMIREIEEKQNKIQSRYVKTMAVRERIVATYKEEKTIPTEAEIEIERFQRRLADEEDHIGMNEKRIEKAEEEGRFLERGLLSTTNKLLSKQLRLGEINAEVNVLRNRIERFKVLSAGLQSGDSLAMYRAYIIGAPDIGIADEHIDAESVDAILKQKEIRLNEIREKLSEAKKLVESKRKRLGDPTPVAEDSGDMNGVELPTSRSAPDVRNDPKAPKSQLARFDTKRRDILRNEEKAAVSDLEERKQKLSYSVAVLSTQNSNAITEFERLSAEIDLEEKRAAELEQNLRKAEEEFQKAAETEKQRNTEIRRKKEERTNELYRRLIETEVRLFDAESQRNDLFDRLRQSEVDEDNLRNRFQTFRGLRQSQRESTMRLKNTQQTVEDWRQRVQQNENQLEELRRILNLSKKQNQTTKRSLATLKPYYDEVAEYESLMSRKKILEEQHRRLERQRISKEAETKGDITITDAQNV